MKSNTLELHDLENTKKSDAVQICLNIIDELKEENKQLNNKLTSVKTNLKTIQTRVNHLMESYSLS